METVRLYLGGGAPKSLKMVTAAMKLKDAHSLDQSYQKPGQCIKKHRHYFADKGMYSQSYGFSIVMYGCQNWTIKKAESQRIDAFKLWCWRRLLRVGAMDCKAIKPVNPKRNQP